MTLRSARLSDISGLVDIENTSFPSDLISKRQLMYHLKNPRAVFIVFDIDDQPAGYILALARADNTARIYSLAVSGQFRGRGIGRDLIDTALTKLRHRKIKTIRLEVDENDARTINLYQSFGFVKTKHLPAYYEDGRGAIKMEMKYND